MKLKVVCMEQVQINPLMSISCGHDVKGYRQCGIGKQCTHEIAYCPTHGGDDRAQQEMQLHHTTVHNKEIT